MFNNRFNPTARSTASTTVLVKTRRSKVGSISSHSAPRKHPSRECPSGRGTRHPERSQAAETASIVAPIPVPETVLSREFPAVIVMSILLFPLLRSGWRIRRWEGAILVATYLGIGGFLL